LNLNGPENVIIVGIDGSPAAQAALTWAAKDASRRKAALHLVQSFFVSIEYAGPGMMVPPQVFDDARKWAQRSLRDARTDALRVDPDLVVMTTVHAERPFVALRNASKNALMTVVGSRGLGMMSEILLGSVAMNLATHAHSPVVVVHADPDGDPPPAPAAPDAPVMVGLDGSPESDVALAFALEEASLRGVPLVAVHGWDDAPLNGFQRVYALEMDRTVIDEDERRLLAEQLAGSATRYPDVEIRQLVERGHAGASLLRTSHDIPPCLLVVGSRGRGGFAGLLLGSTSHRLVIHAACPVAVVRIEQP
jgi:nucleotide-binding universal stress UspA family protein